MADYEVTFGESFEKHYGKSFLKKHKDKRWGETKKAIVAICARIDAVLQTALCDEIKSLNDCTLAKLDFAIAGTKVSPKNSGCRAILHIDNANHEVTVLIAYHKSDIERINNNETLAWKSLVSDEYPDVRSLL